MDNKCNRYLSVRNFRKKTTMVRPHQMAHRPNMGQNSAPHWQLFQPMLGVLIFVGAKGAWRGHNIKQLNFKHVNYKKARCAQCMVSMVSCTDINQLVAVLALFLVTPISHSKLTASTCPFWVAMFRVIAPSMVLALLISAPASVSKRSISTWPLSAAKCNGVVPVSIVALSTSAQATISKRATLRWQFSAASCNGVVQSSVAALSTSIQPQSASEQLQDGLSQLPRASVLFHHQL